MDVKAGGAAAPCATPPQGTEGLQKAARCMCSHQRCQVHADRWAALDGSPVVPAGGDGAPDLDAALDCVAGRRVAVAVVGQAGGKRCRQGSAMAGKLERPSVPPSPAPKAAPPPRRSHSASILTLSRPVTVRPRCWPRPLAPTVTSPPTAAGGGRVVAWLAGCGEAARRRRQQRRQRQQRMWGRGWQQASLQPTGCHPRAPPLTLRTHTSRCPWC